MSRSRELRFGLILFGAALSLALGFAIRVPERARANAAQAVSLPGSAQAVSLRGPAQAGQPVPQSLAPVFVPAADGSFEARTADYQALLSAAQGLTYRPLTYAAPASRLLPQEQKQTELRVKLKQVARGENIIFDGVAANREFAARDGGSGLSCRRASGLEERYVPRGDGVEQSFVLADLPAGPGPLRFVCELELRGLTALPPRPGRGGGLLFVDAKRRCAARYGQVMVRDSCRHGLVLEPQLAADRRSVSFAVPETWLREARCPLEVDPLVGGGDFQISQDNPYGVGPPAVAAGANNFLVVWDDLRAGVDSPQMMASVVTPSAIVSAPIALSGSSGAPRGYRFQRVEIAFDGTNWLVVWTQDEQAGAEIHGALVSAGTSGSNLFAGTLIGNTDFLIATTTGTVEEDPLVAFNGSDFVVAWTSGVTTSGSSTTATGSQIYFTRVTSQGTVANPQTIPAQTATPNQALLFLAPQTPVGATLVIYRENSENPALTRAARIAQNGTVLDPGGISLFLESATGTPQGFGRPIGVAFIGSDWQILSSLDQTTNSAVYLHHLSTLGVVTPPQGVFAVVGLGPTGTPLDLYQYVPAFAGTVGAAVTTNGNPVGEWLFLRSEMVNSTTYHILGKRIGFDGTDQDPIPFQIDSSSTGNLGYAVAAQYGNQFLVAWLDGRRKATVAGDVDNIFGALVDATVADPGTALLPVIVASPTSGSAPLDVSFDGHGSTGSYDTLTWAFGDGTTSTYTTTTHRYSQNGTYVAQLTLTKGYYSVIGTTIITVGAGGAVGQNFVGTPLASSEGLVTNLFIKSASLGLDFTQLQNDTAVIGGTIDATTLPVSLTGLTGSVSIGSVGHPFALDAKGQFKSNASQTPLYQFTLNGSTGVFSLQVTKDNLQPELDVLGAHNTTVSPAIIVDVPITVQVGTLNATAVVGLKYKATIKKSGTGTYSFQRTGQIASGTFLITSFAAQEVQLPGNAGLGHNFTIAGQLVLPNGAKYQPSNTGNFLFEVGDYSTSLPCSQFVVSKGAWKFTARSGATGLKKFSVNVSSGVFSLQLTYVPATGVGGSNLWLDYGNNIVDVDLNLSFQFDLVTQKNFTAGRYVSIARKLYTSRKWTLK